MHRAGVISHRNRPDGLSGINTTVVDHERTGVTSHPYRHEVGRERTGVFHHRFRHEIIIPPEGVTP